MMVLKEMSLNTDLAKRNSVVEMEEAGMDLPEETDAGERESLGERG